jgi:hypothetical protein
VSSQNWSLAVSTCSARSLNDCLVRLQNYLLGRKADTARKYIGKPWRSVLSELESQLT